MEVKTETWCKKHPPNNINGYFTPILLGLRTCLVYLIIDPAYYKTYCSNNTITCSLISGFVILLGAPSNGEILKLIWRIFRCAGGPRQPRVLPRRHRGRYGGLHRLLGLLPQSLELGINNYF